MTAGTTKELANYISTMRYEDLPDDVVDGALRAVIDSVGNIISASLIAHRLPLINLARSMGRGVPEASLFRNGERITMTSAAFGNCAQATIIDFCDAASSRHGHVVIWPGAITVPAALAAVEATRGSGRALLTSVVAGYECGTRIVRAMDIDSPLQGPVQARGPSVFCSAAAAGHALGLDPAQMTSALGMAGVYCPVSAGYRFYGDEGLVPRAHITHGWAWMSLSGVFAAQSASAGLEMLQEQNILDGDRGLWRMLGMTEFDPEAVTKDLGKSFSIPNFNTKGHPGCSFTHGSIIGTGKLLSDNGIDVDAIEQITVATNTRDTVGFEDRSPTNLVDRMFSLPEQLSIALVAGEPGPGWYAEDILDSPARTALADRIRVAVDEECEAARDHGKRITKIELRTKDGRVLHHEREGGSRLSSLEDIEAKFLTSVGQVVGSERASAILEKIHHLPEAENLDDLIHAINQ